LLSLKSIIENKLYKFTRFLIDNESFRLSKLDVDDQNKIPKKATVELEK
jgi:hypothetical protein